MKLTVDQLYTLIEDILNHKPEDVLTINISDYYVLAELLSQFKTKRVDLPNGDSYLICPKGGMRRIE